MSTRTNSIETFHLSQLSGIPVPDICILKTEKFDIDMASWLCQTQDISSEEKRRIRSMFKNKTKGNQFTAQYILGKVAKHEFTGRWIAKASIGLQGLSRDTRNALAVKYYWDIDFKNCQVEILRQIAKVNGWSCKALDEYCENRDALFAEIMITHEVTRDEIKVMFIRILFGGNKCVKDPKWINEVFFPEVQLLMKNLCQTQPELLKKCQKSTKMGVNPFGSCCAHILQTEERKCLEALDRGLAKHSRELSVYIHDGGYVEKLPNEREFPPELLVELSLFVKLQTNYELELSQKNIETSFVLPNIPVINEGEDFDAVKLQFELNNFKCIGESCYYDTSFNAITIRSHTALITAYRHLKYFELTEGGVKNEKSFIAKWIDLPSMRVYQDTRMIPPPSICPISTYNLWTGFSIESHLSSIPTESELSDLNFLKDHIFLLCNKDSAIFEYVKNWISNLFQFPGIKPNVMPLFKSREGLGKQDGLYEIIAQIVGHKYCLITQKIERDIVGDFNIALKNKLLIVLDEMSLAVACRNEEELKDMITRTYDQITSKGRDTQSIQSFGHYMSYSNSDFPWKITDTDRRYFAIDASSQEVPGGEYFSRIRSLHSNAPVLRLFYDEMMNIDLSSWDAKLSRPETQFSRDLKEINRPLEIKFFIDYIQSLNQDCNIIGKDLFTKFTDFLNTQGTTENKYSTTNQKFSIKLTNLNIGGFTNLRTKVASYQINLKQVTSWLISKNYIEGHQKLI